MPQRRSPTPVRRRHGRARLPAARAVLRFRSRGGRPRRGLPGGLHLTGVGGCSVLPVVAGHARGRRPTPPTAHWPSASPFLPDWPSRVELRRLRVGEAAVSLAFRTGRRCHRILPARTGEADPGDHDRTSSPRRAGPRRQPTCPRPLRPAAWTSSAASAGSWCSRRRCGALSCLVAGYFLAGSK